MRLPWRLAHRLPVGRGISMGTLRENERLLLGGFCASSLHCRECNMRPIMKALRGTLPLLSGLYRAHSITNAARADVPTGLSVTPGCVVWKMPSIAFSAIHFSCHMTKHNIYLCIYGNEDARLHNAKIESHCSVVKENTIAFPPGLAVSLMQTVAVYYQGKCDSKGNSLYNRLYLKNCNIIGKRSGYVGL